MACNFCKSALYIKTVQYTKPLLAPVTRAEQLRQELLDLTGEVYLQIPNEYCAMCGERITRTPKERGGEKRKFLKKKKNKGIGKTKRRFILQIKKQRS